MTFTVTYRGADGALVTEAVDATSRAECFAQMKERGITPMSVKEGNFAGNPRKSIHPRTSGASRKPITALITAIMAVAVILGTGIWWWCGHAGRVTLPEPETPKKSAALPKEVKPAEAPKPVAMKAEAQTSGTNAEASAVRNVRMEHGVEVVSVQTRTNSAGTVVEKLRLADGQVIENVYPPKPIFSNPSDQMIAMALSFKPGQSMAPFPSLSNMNQDFANSLLSPIVINDDDPEDVKEQKRAVKEARAYIVAEIKNGRTVAECLNEYRDQLEKIADRHQMAILEIQKLKANGTPEEDIVAFKKSVNELFREQGIPELPISSEKTKKRQTKE